MYTVIAGSNHLVVNFYSAYFEMMEMENEHYNSISVGLKRAQLNQTVKNILVVLETREDFLIFNKLKTSIDENLINLIIVCMSDEIMNKVVSPKSLILSHKEITQSFAGPLGKMHICKPYLQDEIKVRTPEKTLKHIQAMMLNNSITLPVKNDCAITMLGALDNDDISFKKIEKIAQSDPALHSGIIRMANSVYFGGAFSNIKDLEKALIRVGMANVKTFLINFINRSLTENKDLIFLSDITASIEKSILVASFCYVIAEDFKVSSPITMFSIGLMSCIGEIFMFAALSDYFSGTELDDSDMEDYRTLTKNIGVLLSGKLLKKWKFSEEYYTPVINAVSLSQNTHMKETKILHLAMHMEGLYLNGAVDKELEDAMSSTQVLLNDSQLDKIRNDAENHLCMITSVLS